MTSEKFCLKWNNFETNISSAFKDIREEKQFFDITIACEDEQLQAHKVILSACSPFFKNVLYRNHHQHPLLYLKGVSFRDMEAVINFMYHGEVNVAQDDLNSFLQVAEDLRIKGLTQNDSGTTDPAPKTTRVVDPPKSTKHSNSDPAPSPKRARPAPTYTVQHQTNEIEETMPVVKSEPSETTTSPMGGSSAPVVQKQSLAMYDDRSQQIETNMMMTMDTEQYDESYDTEQYDGHFEDQSYDTNLGGQDNNSGLKTPCPYCERTMHQRSLQRHIQTQHSETEPIQCELCNEVFRHQGNLKDHIRRKHKIYKTKTHVM